MRVFLYKDWRVMRRQIILPAMLLWVLGIGIALRQEMAVSMGAALVCGMLPFLTIAYDEASRYLSFALSQPVSRRGYVWSKYLPNLVLIGLLAIHQLVLHLVPGIAGTQPHIMQALLSLMFPCLVTALLLPLVFKLGTAKARIAYILVILGFSFGVNQSKVLVAAILRLSQGLSSLNPVLIALGGSSLLVLLMALSIHLSISFVEAKDY